MRVQALVATAVAACSVLALAGCATEPTSTEEAVASSSEALSTSTIDSATAKAEPQFAYAVRSAEDLRACPGDINDPWATTAHDDGCGPTTPVKCDAFVAKKLNSDESWQYVDAAEIHNLKLSVTQAQSFQSAVKGNGAIVIGSIVIGSKASIVIGSRSSIVIGSRSAIVIGSRSGIVIGSRPAIVIGSRAFAAPVAIDPTESSFYSVTKPTTRTFRAVTLNSSAAAISTSYISSRGAGSAAAAGEIIVAGDADATGIYADAYLAESKGACSVYGCTEATACVR